MAASVASSSLYDEVTMKQSMLFTESLKDLMNLKSQLYAAAEYFEQAYADEGQKQTVMESLKDYAVKAVVNTVDHLGSMSFKANELIGHNANVLSKTELRISCIEQRVRTCKEYIEHEGLVQQSLMFNTPKYHRRYILPAGETMSGIKHTKLKHQGCSFDDKDNWNHLTKSVMASMMDTGKSSNIRENSPLPAARPPIRSATFAVPEIVPRREPDKRASSPLRFFSRSGSFMNRSTSPNLFKMRRQNSMQYSEPPRRSFSAHHMEKERPKDNHVPSKGKSIFKALLSKRKSKKADLLHKYLDAY